MTTLADSAVVPTAADARAEALLDLRELTVEYGVGPRPARAVDGIDLQIREGEVVGLAGESGCGKTTVASAVLQILRPPGRIVGGSILFQGEELIGKDAEALRRFRWRNVSIVFQSAMNALNPLMRVGDQFVDAMRAHERIDRRRALVQAGELLERVGIDRRRVRAYPHELSGGMRQRVIIAIALALRPELIVMDEPTTALDVVVQREILQQIDALKREFGFAVLFITHDLSLLLEFADRISIMYAGEIVETAPAERLGDEPPAPVHAGPAPLVPAADGAADAFDRDPRRAARSPRPAARLPVQPAVSALRARPPGAVRAADDGAPEAARGGARPPGRVSPRRGRPRDDAGRAARGAQPVEALLGRQRGAARALHAVDDVSFELRPGTMTALVGESGSGKSTVVRLLARLVRPDRRHGALRRERRVARPEPARRPALPVAGADHLPGPVRRR